MDQSVRLLNRPEVKGKFLFVGGDKFYVKGVTYGTFEPAEDGSQFPSRAQVDYDFEMMAARGLNCVRVYTVPPASLLDTAHKYGLKVMIGLPWEQHLTFLETTKSARDIIQRVKEGVKSCHQHPAILCYAVGNEIPATIVRWYGATRIQRFIKKLYDAVKQVDPECLVTYVNYPTTEYLELNFLDFHCFNVYLETEAKLKRYIARLHNLSGDKPLLLAEIGLDSQRNGVQQQADTLVWQINTIFAQGCAGMFVFAWTDEWWRGGSEIDDWDFGLVDRQRQPKPALAAVQQAMAGVPFGDHNEHPYISVVVCTYNGSATIRDTMEGLMDLDYRNFEIIVVNDGSTDGVEGIVNEYPVQLISTENRGLSNARNTGLFAARGEIVAYIDDDAYPDPQWLRYIAYAYRSSDHGGIGGPNIVPPDDGLIATCVANAPGGPVHVLITDEIAEHIPGCNMTFKRAALMEVGGFDPVYRAAGDDVDICWRVQEAGYTIGYHPGALVWHHRRNSLKAYWKQQKGYGKAEALLEEKWPERYNSFGHLNWGGRIYGNGVTLPLKFKKKRIFHGSWGGALFQSVYAPAGGYLSALPLMPEWYLITGILGIGALLSLVSPYFLVFLPLFIIAFGLIIIQSVKSALTNSSLPPGVSKTKYHGLITLLHMFQPLARLYGRINYGLTPWRKRGAGIKKSSVKSLGKCKPEHWSEEWHAPEYWLEKLEYNLKSMRVRVKRGGDFDPWDMQIKTGFFMVGRLVMAIEEYGGGKQFVKFKYRLRLLSFSLIALILAALFTTTLVIAGEMIPGIIIGGLVLSFLTVLTIESINIRNSICLAIKQLGEPDHNDDNMVAVDKMKDRLLEEEIFTNDLEVITVTELMLADLRQVEAPRKRKVKNHHLANPS